MIAPTPQTRERSSSLSVSRAVDSAIDAYATKVLQSSSAPDAAVDASLGPYVTSVLRSSEITDQEQITTLSEFESLLELLEDQCSMENDSATKALKTIAKAVVTQMLPDEPVTPAPTVQITKGLFSVNGRSSLDSFETMKQSLPTTQSKLEQLSIDPYTPTAAGGPSPLKPDNLIPIDLLGVLDDPLPALVRQQQQQQQAFFPTTQQQQQQALGTIAASMPTVSTPQPEEQKIASDEAAFPPLGATSSTKQTTSKKGRPKKTSKAKNSDKELAAALFRPSRPRQNSVVDEESSPVQTPLPNPAASGQHNVYFQQQWDSCVEILLSMNNELSEEAAAEAGLMANLDFNVAQYLVDSAMTAAPVCRHMLHEGCYRSDCQFSHDVEGHTCLFWLRGRCTKASTCKFLHGFNPKLMEGIRSNGEMPNGSQPVPISLPAAAPSGFGDPVFHNSYSSPAGSSFPTTGGTLASSWQAPSVLESSASNSHSSTVSNGSTSNGSNGFSFANIASRGYDKHQFAASPSEPNGSKPNLNTNNSLATIATVRIPQDLWNPHENRDSSVFYVADPMERYRQVTAATAFARKDVIDLHFQSTKTFGAVLKQVLPAKLAQLPEVWIVTGTGHHVGSKTHQKGGGALERAVFMWLLEEGYTFCKGKDRNGLGGAVLVKR